MAMSKNVIRQDVVQISFDVDRDPIKGIQDTLDRIAKAAEGADDALKGLNDPLGETGESAEKAGKGMLGAAGGLNDLLVAAGGYKVLQLVKSAFESSASAAIEFESAITGVYKTVDGTPEQLKELSDATREMALSMPTDTTTIAGVMESAGQLGIATDGVKDFSKTMIDLGNSTNLTAEQAASSLAKFANITGMSADNYSNLGSAIVDLGNNFATTEADIVDMSSYLSSAATLAGFAETDILGLSTAMSSVGINAEAGGSAMSQLITKMQTAVETGDASLEQFASIANMTSQQFQQAFGANAVGALQAFIMGLNDVERNGASASVILQDMGLDGIRLSNTVKALASSGGLLTNAVNTANTAWQENTALANEAEKRYSTLESKMQIMQNAANDLKISVGNSLTPAMGLAADAATSLMKGLSSAADTCPTFTGGVMGAVGAIGGLGSAAMTALPLLAQLSQAMQGFRAAKEAGSLPGFLSSLTMGKVGLIIGGIAAAGAAIGALSGAFSKAEKEVEDYNGTLEECANEIAQVQGQYDSVVKVFGEQSEAAKELEEQLDTLNAQYKKGGGAAADFAKRAEENAQAIKETSDRYADQIKAIDEANISGQTAAAMLASISEQSVITNADLDMMSQYANYLNDTFECDIKVNYDTKSLTGFDPNDVNDIMIAQATANRTKAAKEQLASTDFINEYVDAFNILQGYEKTRSDIEAHYGDMSWVNTSGLDINETKSKIKESESKINSLKNSIYELYDTAGMSRGAADQYIDWLESVANGTDKAAAVADDATPKIAFLSDAYKRSINSMSDYKKMQNDIAELQNGAISEALQGQADMLTEVAQKYDEVYNSAYESLSGQYGLFDKAKDKITEVLDAFNQENETDYSGTEGVLQARLDTLDSQIKDMEQLNDAVKVLSDSTYNDIMMTEQRAQDLYIGGASDAARYQAESLNMWDSYKDAMLEKIASGDKEAQAEMLAISTALKNGQTSVVADIVGKWYELNQSTQEVASGIGEEVADVQQAMALTQTVIAASLVTIGLDSISAYNAAQNVVSGLASGIESGIGVLSEKVSAVESLMSRLSSFGVSSGGRSLTPTVNSPSDLKYFASGTSNAPPGLALVGENGPELVNFGGGEVVYTADETRQIMRQQALFTDLVTMRDAQTYDSAPIGNYSGTTTNNYSPSFVLNYTSNGGGESEATVKRWIREAMDEVFDDMSAENAPVWEV